MKHILLLLSTLTLFPSGLEAQAMPMKKNIIVETFAKPIEAADLATFEKLFNAYEITTEEQNRLINLARIARTKLQIECETMGTYTRNAATLLTGLAQGVVGLWAFFLTIYSVCFLVSINRDTNEIVNMIDNKNPKDDHLIALWNSNYLFIKNKNIFDNKGKLKKVLDKKLPWLRTDFALMIPLSTVLTAYAFNKAGVNITRGLNYKKYLETKIANLDAIIEYLA